MSGQEADSDHPYGHGRIEYLAGLSVSAIILIMAAELAKSSFEKILHPTLPEISPVIFLILVVSILVKLYMYFYNHKIAGAIDSSAMNATASDSFGDVLATSVVLLSSVIGWIFGLAIDGWCGLLVAIFIFYSGVALPGIPSIRCSVRLPTRSLSQKSAALCFPIHRSWAFTTCSFTITVPDGG